MWCGQTFQVILALPQHLGRFQQFKLSLRIILQIELCTCCLFNSTMQIQSHQNWQALGGGFYDMQWHWRPVCVIRTTSIKAIWSWSSLSNSWFSWSVWSVSRSRKLALQSYGLRVWASSRQRQQCWAVCSSWRGRYVLGKYVSLCVEVESVAFSIRSMSLEKHSRMNLFLIVLSHLLSFTVSLGSSCTAIILQYVYMYSLYFAAVNQRRLCISCSIWLHKYRKPLAKCKGVTHIV